MKNILYILAFLLFYTTQSQSDVTDKSNFKNNPLDYRPKLVVGIVIDQMRFDYLTRFYNRYGEAGFKRLLNEGFNCRNNHFNYIPTKTAPGHASIYTGATPKYHGIIGNDWYSRKNTNNVYCVNDPSVSNVGSTGYAGEMSPHRMLSTTFADENRLFTQMEGKTVSISIKDRGAILPGGHTANAAYWYDLPGNGNWISSSFYMKKLPDWVMKFNESNITEEYFKVWDTYYPIDTYNESGLDVNDFEGGFRGKDASDFPYDLRELKEANNGYELIAETPFGNSLTTDFAIAAIKAEELGKDNITDVLAISYSSTDKVGHNFGPNSKEVEDTYIRLDLDIARLLDALDELVGEDQYTLFLTSDHGALEVPNYLKSLKIPAGLFDLNDMKAELNKELEEEYGITTLILSTINNQIYLDHQKLLDSDIDVDKLKSQLVLRLLQYDAIDKAFAAGAPTSIGNEGELKRKLDNGYHQKRSGDILFQFNPAYFKDTLWNRTGTDHGTGLNYDTHVPLIFFGKGIAQGSTFQRTEITDIAPTISALLGISFPNASIGDVLGFVFKN